MQAKLADRLIVMRGTGAVAELAEALAVCGGPLDRQDEDGRTTLLARLERERPDYFLLIRNIVYLSYYESPAVHEAIRAMGFTYNTIPLPTGYEVGKFNPVADMPRHWRGHFLQTDEVKRVNLSRLDFLEAAMAEPARKADVLVIGSGASGAIASMVLGKTGLRVVCLEQGGWTMPEDHPHNSHDWEWQRQKRWHPNNNIRKGRDDFPVQSTTSNILMWNAVGGSTNVYTALWPRYRPSDFKKGVEHGLAPDWPIAYEDLAPIYDRVDRIVGVSGLVHRSRQKIHPPMTLHPGVLRFQPYQGAGMVNRLYASVH